MASTPRISAADAQARTQQSQTFVEQLLKDIDNGIKDRADAGLISFSTSIPTNSLAVITADLCNHGYNVVPGVSSNNSTPVTIGW